MEPTTERAKIPAKTSESGLSIHSDIEKLHTDGITALRGAFSQEWVHRMRNDVMTAFWESIQRPGGAVGRGPRRWYVEVHPQMLSGFVNLASHPWVIALSEAVLGPDFQIVEIGFDVPFEGAKYQPWHRDFPSPRETYEQRKLTSLAFNLTCVDVAPDMGPFEIALGTQWDDGREWKHEMFPPRELAKRFDERARRSFPKMGDVSCRSALTIHRGTAHESMTPRPVVVLGVDAPGAGHAALHDLQVTKDFYESMPEVLKRHLVCRIVDRLEPIQQKHSIEGLVMGAEKDF
ncbi:MAG: phytanoyl-CoA dioxygenase family protein [Bdellovibrionia bacterium]